MDEDGNLIAILIMDLDALAYVGDDVIVFRPFNLCSLRSLLFNSIFP